MLELTGTTTVRELLTTHPQTFEILLSHGMCEDCQHNPPLVPLAHFAGKHCGGDLEGLIAQLNSVIKAATS